MEIDKTYVARVPSPLDGHVLTIDNKEMFLDFLKLKNVVSMNYDIRAGEPPVLTLVLYITALEYHGK